jgi:hypothetical protein
LPQLFVALPTGALKLERKPVNFQSWGWGRHPHHLIGDAVGFAFRRIAWITDGKFGLNIVRRKEPTRGGVTDSPLQVSSPRA